MSALIWFTVLAALFGGMAWLADRSRRCTCHQYRIPEGVSAELDADGGVHRVMGPCEPATAVWDWNR